MLTIEKKTRDLGRKFVPITQLEANASNPNKMSDREFDLLVSNLEDVGFTDPVLVRPLGKDKYRIIGGHHRVEGAKYLGFEEVPVTIITDPAFDEEAEEMQLLRHNTIHGKIDPQKFFDLYAKHAGKYGDEVLQEMMGFADEAEFQKLIKQTAQTLPQEMKKKFEEAAKEVKTVEGLAKLLNTMFTKYGDTLPFGYMVVEYGGQQSIWLQVGKPTMNAFEVVSDICIENKRTMDDVIGALVQLIAKGEAQDLVAQMIAKSPEVSIPTGLQVAPTKDNIAKIASLKA